MVSLYVSTDSREIKELTKNLTSQEYDFLDMPIEKGKYLEAKIGFNPMSFLDGRIDVTSFPIQELTKSGLYVAVIHDELVKTFVPEDLSKRTNIIKCSLYALTDTDYWNGIGRGVMATSNTPDKIRILQFKRMVMTPSYH